MPTERINSEILDSIIIGRVEPHIYAFTTETVPNYLKVGDTYRPLKIRLDEWRDIFPNLNHVYSHSARIDKDTIFRDFSIHHYLESVKSRHRLLPHDIPSLPYYSREFFENATTEDVDEAIADIHKSAKDNDGRYALYSSDHLTKTFTYTRGECYTPRENQQEVIDNFIKAINNGRKNLLMFAVMRFGKSFTSMCCAKEMGANTVLVVTAKADVKDEWKKTVESIGNFEGYIFADKSNLQSSNSYIRDSLKSGNKVVLFLTLQDLQGNQLKDTHREVFAMNWDLLLVDETHFGARAEHYGRLLLTKREASAESARQMKDVDTLDDLDAAIKELRTRITIHLSGTPYRILMGGEFGKEDIISFVQFSDIAEAQSKWIEEHKFDEETPEWENPYYGFPQMIRFAFTPNRSSLERIEQLKATGATTSFSELFRPISLSASNKGYDKFIHEDVVLDFLKVIDGIKNDSNILGFLDNDRIKEGKLCHHMVFVLPYCASCDAMESLIKQNSTVFRHLSRYEIINISGVSRRRRFDKTSEVKQYIAKCEIEEKRTITLTVNRMLTGNTVPQWDTMLFLKQSSSPEEYDQAIFRLQNPFIDVYEDNGKVVKFNMKPQTMLVDFDPERVFRLQERKSQIYNINTENNGNSRLRERIETELRISPIITLDHNKLREVTAANILDAVRNYAETRSVMDEASDMPVDFSLLENAEFREIIDSLNEIDSKKGLKIPVNSTGNGQQKDDVGSTASGKSTEETNFGNTDSSENDSSLNEVKSTAKKFAAYYALILFFAFLTDDKVASLEEIIKVIDSSDDNKRISKNLGLNSNILRYLQSHSDGFALNQLDYKIQNTNSLNHDENKTPLKKVKTALTKFGRMSVSEVVTPLSVAEKMVKLLPDDIFRYGPILDIAAKQGEFAIALFNRFGDSISDKIYSVCTSKLAYEFTRKVYKLLSLPIDQIYDSFTSYDLIKRNENKDFIIPKTLKAMNFYTIVGNPPYQIQNKGNGNGADPIYHLFIEFARKLSCISTLIHPARFLFDAGKTPKNWNQKILNQPDFKVVDYWPTSTDVFPNVDVKGGIANTFSWGGKDFGKIGLYSPYPEIRSILRKVRNSNFVSFSELVSPRDLYKLNTTLYDENPQLEGRQSEGHRLDIGSSIFDILPEVFFDDKPEIGDYIGLYGIDKRNRVTKWIKREYVKTPDNIDSYKVLVPKSNGSGALGEVLSTPVIGIPSIGHTLTFLSIGKFSKASQAEACLKYIKTRFARILLGTLKVTQDNPRDTWANIPLQDFSEGSDIDWSKSVEGIDAQLYAKYGLSDDEIVFIESMIKPM